MGILRFVLAAAVVCGHSSPFFGLPILDSGLAVKSFFVISGFYMTLILDAKYERKRHSLWLFYSNRFLRIFPMYYVTLIVCLLIYAAAVMATGKPVDRLQYWVDAAHLGLWVQLFLLALAQLLIIGIELSSFFAFDPKEGFVWESYGGAAATIPGWRFSFLPQTWTIGIELVFYMVVPFLIHLQKRVLWTLVAINLAAVALLTQVWPSSLHDNMVGHLFPFEMGYFVLGILAYRLFYKRAVPGYGTPGFNRMLIGIIAVATVALGIPHFNGSTHFYFSLVYISLLFFGITFLFHATKQSAADRFIGELSYPMYLTHLPIKWIVSAAMGMSHRAEFVIPGSVLLPATIFFSVLMVLFVDYPVDRFRQRRIGNPSATALPHGNPAVT